MGGGATTAESQGKAIRGVARSLQGNFLLNLIRNCTLLLLGCVARANRVPEVPFYTARPPWTFTKRVGVCPLVQAATEAQAPLLKKLVENSGGKLKEKGIKKSLDLILKKKTALDKDAAEYIRKGGADYLAKKKEELAAALA